MNEWEWQLLEEKTTLDSIAVLGVAIKPGDRVRLRPRSGGATFSIWRWPVASPSLNPLSRTTRIKYTLLY